MNNDFLADFDIKQTIGKGTFSIVKLGINKITNEKVAIKVFKKKNISGDNEKLRIKREISISKKLNHINVIKIYKINQDEEKYYIFMEYCENGELFNYIVEHQRLDEDESAYFFYQLINGLDYIHHKNIVHRDLKPENLLLGKGNILKIVDFGLSNYYEEGELLSTPCGSPCYASPEMVCGNDYNGIMIDIWSCGIIIFAMTCGYLPFEDPDNEVLFKKIIKCKIDYPKFLSEEALDIMQKILVNNPNERIKIKEIKQHPFYLRGRNIFKLRHQKLIKLVENNNEIDNKNYYFSPSKYYLNNNLSKKESYLSNDDDNNITEPKNIALKKDKDLFLQINKPIENYFNTNNNNDINNTNTQNHPLSEESNPKYVNTQKERVLSEERNTKKPKMNLNLLKKLLSDGKIIDFKKKNQFFYSPTNKQTKNSISYALNLKKKNKSEDQHKAENNKTNYKKKINIIDVSKNKNDENLIVNSTPSDIGINKIQSKFHNNIKLKKLGMMNKEINEILFTNKLKNLYSCNTTKNKNQINHDSSNSPYNNNIHINNLRIINNNNFNSVKNITNINNIKNVNNIIICNSPMKSLINNTPYLTKINTNDLPNIQMNKNLYRNILKTHKSNNILIPKIKGQKKINFNNYNYQNSNMGNVQAFSLQKNLNEKNSFKNRIKGYKKDSFSINNLNKKALSSNQFSEINYNSYRNDYINISKNKNNNVGKNKKKNEDKLFLLNPLNKNNKLIALMKPKNNKKIKFDNYNLKTFLAYNLKTKNN